MFGAGALRGLRQLFRRGAGGPASSALRLAYEVRGLPASNAGFTSIVRWGEQNRARLIIRNPADSTGNAVLGTKSAASNAGIDTGNVGSSPVTLSPGQELVDEGGTGAWLARSDQTTVPAGAYLTIEAEIA